MAAMDPLSALQTNLDQLSEQFYVAIGVLQRDAASVPIPDFPLQAGAAISAMSTVSALTCPFFPRA